MPAQLFEAIQLIFAGFLLSSVFWGIVILVVATRLGWITFALLDLGAWELPLVLMGGVFLVLVAMVATAYEAGLPLVSLTPLP